MTVPEPEPVPDLDDLAAGTIGAVPAVGAEELTQGYGVTELGASCGDLDCGGCEVVA
ncbi:hypothetical protein ACIGNX_12045 [Actinosynnema sp. NPDC053489]|uniref:hypothetical protein n=1 Tax=Actinosynnema sp. NPDC053489 TaxID=3363916 RepID=UPI0037C939AA